ncbi:neoverrucotoxin subunit alpha-like [Oreochromis niloticus]|uniref:neoverrucotoxin subunit alpha-like n=1 Tax=Oreochromis niloticus TaxID=8128 RepID=UPI00022B27E8|nr:neoverrucotoxin subunit alpha-like [Oreochromis niloticus]
MDSKTMEVAALDRPFTLGMLYDARSDKLIPGVTLWDAQTLQEKSKEHNQHSSEFEVSATDSIEKKLLLLDVDASLKTSFFSGLFEVGGSAKYLNDKKKSHKQSRVTLQYKATTKFKQLSLTPDKTKKTEQAENVKNFATHVVTGILYGANAFFVFDSETSDAGSIQDIKETMQTLIKKIPSFNVDGKVDIKLSDEEKAATDKFTCKFYGDFILESNPATFEDAVKTYSQLPKLLGENRENCVPLKVTLMPLKHLHLQAAEMKTEINTEVVRKAQNALNDLFNLEIRCNDLLEDRVVRSFPQIQDKLIRFKKLCQYFRSSLQETMAEKLPSIRAGKEDEKELVKVFDDRDKSPFSQEKLTKWIENEEREVIIISYFVDMMEGTKIISDQSELDREVFNPRIEPILCFVFTSLKSTDLYLQYMSDYLDKRTLEDTDGNTPPTQDQWYFSNEVRAKMKKKAEAVKNCSKLFITAIENEKYEGATIYYYGNTNLVTDDFSCFIDDTDVEKVTNRAVLMIYACNLTLDANTAQHELFVSEENKQVTYVAGHKNPNLPQESNGLTQVLCIEALKRQCYWEVDCYIVIGEVSVGVCYKQLQQEQDQQLGNNKKSWCISLKNDGSKIHVSAKHNKNELELQTIHPARLGVFLNWPAGTLSYYEVSAEKLNHIHTFKTKFYEPVYPAFYIYNCTPCLDPVVQLMF